MEQTTTHGIKDYRSFGIVFACGISLIFGLFLPWVFEHAWPTWPWIVAGISLTLALIAPITLKPVYIVWMKIGLVLGWINTRIILGIIFYLLFTPVSLLLMIIRKDPMRRKIDPESDSYRITSEKGPRQRMENPF